MTEQGVAEQGGNVGELSGRVALVTGSTRGIGLAVATRLAAAGATVMVHGRDQDACDSVAASLQGAIGRACDLGDTAAAGSLVDAAVEATGRLDIVVNNAGVALDNFLTGATDERWEATIAANLTAPFALMRAALRVMKRQGTGGAIVNVTSISGERGNPGQAAYAASKGGLHSLTMTVAKEAGRFGVRVNSVSPLVATEMNGLIEPERRAEMAPRVPMQAVADAAEVGEAVLFLVSDRAKFITGELLHVDGGFHLV